MLRHFNISHDEPASKWWLKTRWNRLVYWSPNWSLLSLFGNTAIARVVILAPVIAQAVHYSEPWIITHFGITNILWLYWSLISMGAGQIFYSIFCPREIKKYGGDRELHKIESLATVSNREFEILFNNYIFSHFAKENGLEKPSNLKYCGPFKLLEITEEELVDRLQQARDGKDPQKFWTGIAKTLYCKTNDQIVDNYNEFKTCTTNGGYFDASSWPIIHALFELHPELCSVEKETYRRLPLLDICTAETDSWKLSALDWAYYFHDVSHSKIRWATIFFYLTGSVYFLYTAFKNVYNMIIHTFEVF